MKKPSKIILLIPKKWEEVNRKQFKENYIKSIPKKRFFESNEDMMICVNADVEFPIAYDIFNPPDFLFKQPLIIKLPDLQDILMHSLNFTLLPNSETTEEIKDETERTEKTTPE